MTLEEKLTHIQLKRKHGIIKAVQQKTNLARITISNFLDGNIYRQHVKDVIDAAYEEVINHEKNKD
jgi:hypothetical protein